ncbi:MAG: universal stress protein, partial [Anaerolineales bacterium]|nr:universal stress protein [Anaerolineales bacterium]
VGSVNRYHDFTRSFLPTRDSNAERWARVRMMLTRGEPMEPIEVYKIGDAYFVIDGNHRVSVSRELGLKTIQARITEIETPVPLSLHDDIDSFLCKARLARFFQQTELDKRRPGLQIQLTACNKYDKLLERIERYQGFLSEAFDRPVSLPDAAEAWYDSVYQPTLEIIHRQGILRDFPDRTEADLFVWLFEHQDDLKEYTGWQLSTGEAVQDLADRQEVQRGGLLNRMGEFIRETVLTDSVTGGPGPGEWRRKRVRRRESRRLFVEIFLILSYYDLGNHALRLALLIAQREKAEIYTSYEVATKADLSSPDVIAKGNEVRTAIRKAGLAVNFQAEVLIEVSIVRERSRWVDLVVAEITYPPGSDIRAKLSSYFHQLLQRCPRPVLAVPPETDSTLSKALLSYDGSPKSREALFVAAYLIQRWPIELVVMAVNEGEEGPALDEARDYLHAGDPLRIEYVSRSGNVAQEVLATAAEYGCDFIIIGGFGHRPVFELMLGSSVEQVLAAGTYPVLVCR